MDAQTHENVVAALHGEAFAYARYRLFANAARKRGDDRLAAMFDGIASAELDEHFAELAECWKLATTVPKDADAGVDLLIEADGGKAKVTNPRSQIKGEGFLPCVVTFFEGIDFNKPKNGRTGVSYSVRFLP